MSPSMKNFTTPDFLVAFGPRDTVLARLPNKISYSDLNVTSELDKLIHEATGINVVAYAAVGTPTTCADPGAEGPPSQLMQELQLDDELDPDPLVAYSYKSGLTTKHKICQSDDEHSLQDLKEWLNNRWSSSGSVHVVSDAQGGWWARSGGGHIKHANLPPALRQLHKPSNPDGEIYHVALGINGAYVAVFKDGHVQYDLAGCYDVLDEHLQARSQGEIVYISLSPFRSGHFFAAFKDATVLYAFPDGNADLEAQILEAEDLRVTVISETVRATKAPPVKSNPALLRGTAKFVSEVAANAVGGAIASDL